MPSRCGGCGSWSIMRIRTTASCQMPCKEADRLSSVCWKEIFLTCILFTDRVILAAYHCSEEHNFNCKLPVAVASPHCFRWKFLWNILLRRLQSVFPLFISFICVGITVFCCCLNLYKPDLLCLLLMVLPSLTASAKLCSLNS